MGVRESVGRESIAGSYNIFVAQAQPTPVFQLMASTHEVRKPESRLMGLSPEGRKDSCHRST